MLHCHLETVLLRDLRRDIRLDALVYGREYLEAHQIGDEAVGLDVELSREILHDDGAAYGDLLRLLVDGNAAALLWNDLRNARHSAALLLERLLGVAALLALAAALVLVVVNLWGLGFGHRGDRDGNRVGRSGMLKRPEARRRGEARLGRANRSDNLRLDTRRHADRRLCRSDRRGFCRGGSRRLRFCDLRRFCGRLEHGTPFCRRLCYGEVLFKLGTLLREKLCVQLGGDVALFRAFSHSGSAGILRDGRLQRRRFIGVDRADGVRRLYAGGFGRLENLDARHAGFPRYLVDSHASSASSPSSSPAMSLATAWAAA